ncbi:LOW QUALITY PROTEIN: Multihem cytochrome [Parasponia andersonii]|uniref:Multihem cytochrome n=1 Tax=Parasponia andersonii TaxID=3476 RepID=A0A2P5CCW7_PARAD|nr:LOW QUALITY PROTEIN: Multihem cytochrome [Parasponia andersonii]
MTMLALRPRSLSHGPHAHPARPRSSRPFRCPSHARQRSLQGIITLATWQVSLKKTRNLMFLLCWSCHDARGHLNQRCRSCHGLQSFGRAFQLFLTIFF